MKIAAGTGGLNWLTMVCLVTVLGFCPACVQVKTEPIRIEPIYIEITINHRVQKELDDLFADIDKASETSDYAPIQ